jgi:multidrug efflux pump subunit AcrA (membrane-fusion protein)
LICGAVGTAVVMYLTKPHAKKARPPKTAPLVKAVELHKAAVPVTVEAYGTVVPARRLTLQTEVEGRIIHQDPALVPGGVIPAKRKLLQIDPEDYKIQIKELEAALTEARFEVEMEQGRRIVAKREWKLLEKEITTSPVGRRLVLREPHQERAAARVQAAESRLDQARLDEKRTTLICPFNAMVIDESVEVGQLVSRQAKLATLVGTDQFWVQVSVPLGKLQRIRFSRAGKGGSAATVVCDTANGAAIVRTGRVLRLLGDLNTSGRMARVLVAIDNPLDLPTGPGASEAPSGPVQMGAQCILLGSYTKVEIQAGAQDDVYIVPRAALRQGDRLWVVGGDDKLVFRQAEVIWRRSADVLVRCDVLPGEKLVLSRLSAPLAGMKVRVHQPDKSPAASQPDTRTAEGR